MTALATPPLALASVVDVPAPASRRVRGGLPPRLAARYGGPLEIPLREDRPTVIANFVSTLDGVVSYATPEAAGGGEISGFFEPDRFVMAMLRGLADAVLIGAGTLRAAPTEAWTPASIHPDSADAVARMRSELGLRPEPMTVVVSGSGDVDLDHPGLADPAVSPVVVTTSSGAGALSRRDVPSHVTVHDAGSEISATDIVTALGALGVGLIVCEGGPHLFGELLRDGLIDELFLTIAPQLAGRSSSAPRLALVEDVAFDLASAPWARLVGLRQAGDHLFTRYELSGGLDR